MLEGLHTEHHLDISGQTKDFPTPTPSTPFIYQVTKYKEPDYPATISKAWIPLIQMTEVYTFNSKFAKSIRYLLTEKHITGWKKARGDGNCYFTAVMLKFIENIHKPYRSSEQLSKFYSLLLELEKLTNPDENYKKALEKMKKHVNRAIQRKDQLGEHAQVFVEVLELLQDKKFSEICVRVARLVTLKGFKERFSSGELSFFMSKPEREYSFDIITMGVEAEDLTLLILPSALGAQVVQFNIFDDNIYEQIIPEGETHEDQIFIVRRSGHYDLLYSSKEQELDQYCFYNKSYYLLS